MIKIKIKGNLKKNFSNYLNKNFTKKKLRKK